jgi:hypothetical protein
MIDMIFWGTYDVTLGNGRVLRNVRQSGCIFRSAERLSEADFAGGLGRVELKRLDGEGAGEVEVMRHCEIALLEDVPGGGSDFWVRPMSAEKRRQMEIDSNIEYLAMMTGVEL